MKDRNLAVTVTIEKPVECDDSIGNYVSVPYRSAQNSFVLTRGVVSGKATETEHQTFDRVHAKVYVDNPGNDPKFPGEESCVPGVPQAGLRWAFNDEIPGVKAKRSECTPNYLVVWGGFKGRDGKITRVPDVKKFCALSSTAGNPLRCPRTPKVDATKYKRRLVDTRITILDPLEYNGNNNSAADVFPANGQFVIEAHGTVNRPNMYPQQVRAKVYRMDVLEQPENISRFAPQDATYGRLAGANEWHFDYQEGGPDFRIPGMFWGSIDADTDNLLVICIFYGGDPLDSTNYVSTSVQVGGILLPE